MNERQVLKPVELYRISYINYSEPFESYKFNHSIYRIFDEEKAKLLLEDRGIWFSRYTCFRDEYEGRFYEAYVNADEAKFEHLTYNNRSMLAELQLKHYTPYISSWTMEPSEWMWQEYSSSGADSSGQNRAICLETTANDLIGCLGLDDRVVCRSINYYPDAYLFSHSHANRLDRTWLTINNEGGRALSVPDGFGKTLASTLFVKRSCFKSEREIRLMVIPKNNYSEDGFTVPLCKNSSPIKKIIVGSQVSSKTRRKLKSTFCCPVTDRSQWTLD